MQSLKANDFNLKKHQLIYDGLIELYNNNLINDQPIKSWVERPKTKRKPATAKRDQAKFQPHMRNQTQPRRVIAAPGLELPGRGPFRDISGNYPIQMPPVRKWGPFRQKTLIIN